MVSLKGIILGTISTVITVGLVYWLANMFFTSVMSISLGDAWNIINNVREGFHSTLLMQNHPILAFLMSQECLKIILAVGIMGLWVMNIKFWDRE